MLRELAASGDLAALMHQQPPGGRLHERRIVADFLARERGLAAEPERIFLVNGAQQGLDVAVRALLRPGDAVAVDALTYPGFRMLAELQDLDLQPVPALDEGPDLDALERLCARRRIRAIHAMPTLHNPLGWVMPLAQRQRLVEIARRHDCLLIEDAAYAFLAGKAPAALATLAPERCIHVSSLSKSVASGLRFGFMVVPQAWAGRVKAVVRASHWSMPGLVTAMATRWMASGSVRQQEQRMRQEARRRQAIARKALAGMQMLAHPCSLFLWLRLPGELRMDRVATALAQNLLRVLTQHAAAFDRAADLAVLDALHAGAAVAFVLEDIAAGQGIALEVVARLDAASARLLLDGCSLVLGRVAAVIAALALPLGLGVLLVVV
ncbi:predicted protein, partial [Nematostella vectensis]